MNYYNQVVMDVEDLILDFLTYRKNKSDPQYKIQSHPPGLSQLETLEFLPKAAESDRPKTVSDEYEGVYLYQNIQEQHAPNETDFPKPMNDTVQDNEMESLYQLYSELGKKMVPYIDKTIDEYEYEGSPIFDEQIGKETVTRMIHSTIDKAVGDMPDLQEIVAETQRAPVGRYALLCCAVEGILLIELFCRRRPSYRRIMNNRWNFTPYV